MQLEFLSPNEVSEQSTVFTILECGVLTDTEKTGQGNTQPDKPKHLNIQRYMSLPDLVTFYGPRPGNKARLCYNYIRHSKLRNG